MQKTGENGLSLVAKLHSPCRTLQEVVVATESEAHEIDQRWTLRLGGELIALATEPLAYSAGGSWPLLRTVAEIISHSWMDATCSSTSAGKRIF